MTQQFALAFGATLNSEGAEFTILDPELTITGTADAPVVRLDLVGHLRRIDGTVEAIAFRPETVKAGNGGDINWSSLSKRNRLAFVLLERATPGIKGRVYSGADGMLRNFRWSRDADSLPKEATTAIAQLDALGRSELATTVKAYTCDHCPVRVSCPHWIGAIT